MKNKKKFYVAPYFMIIITGCDVFLSSAEIDEHDQDNIGKDIFWWGI